MCSRSKFYISEGTQTESGGSITYLLAYNTFLSCTALQFQQLHSGKLQF